MMKLTIEVSDEYIKERANINAIIEKAKNENGNVAKAMLELFAMRAMESRIEENRKEITITRDDMSGDDELEMFDSVIVSVASLAIVSEKNKESKDNKNKEE